MGSLVTIDLDQVRAEIAKKRQEIAQLEAIEAGSKMFAVGAGAPQTSSVTASGTGTFTPVPSVTTVDVINKSVFEAAKAVLEIAGKPLKTRQIVDLMVQAHYPFGGHNVNNSVYTAMARREEIFKLIEPGLWDLKNRSETNGVSKNGSHS